MRAQYRNHWTSKRKKDDIVSDKLYHRKSDSLVEYAESLFKNKVFVTQILYTRK